MPLSATAALPASERGPVLLCALRRFARICRSLVIVHPVLGSSEGSPDKVSKGQAPPNIESPFGDQSFVQTSMAIVLGATATRASQTPCEPNLRIWYMLLQLRAGTWRRQIEATGNSSGLVANHNFRGRLGYLDRSKLRPVNRLQFFSLDQRSPWQVFRVRFVFKFSFRRRSANAGLRNEKGS